MIPMRLMPVLLAVLLLLAGCNTGTQPTETESVATDGPMSITTSTITPSESTATKTSTATPEPDLPDYPDGIRSPTDVNETAVLGNHRAALDDTRFGDRNFSFQVQYEASVEWTENGTQFAHREVIVNGSAHEYYSTFTSTERPYNQSSWRNRTHTILRNTPDGEGYPLGGSWYGYLIGNNVTADDSTFSSRLFEVGQEVEFEVVQRGYTAAGEPRIVFEHRSNASTTDYSGALRALIGHQPISSAHIRFATRPNGRVTNASWQFQGTLDGAGEQATLNARWTFEYGTSGGTTRPDWVDAVRGTAQQIQVTKANDRTYEVKNRGSLSYPSGTTLAFAFPSAISEVALSESLDPGESVYVAFRSEDFEIVDGPQRRTEYLTLPDRVQVVATVNAGGSHMRLASDSSLVD